MTKKNEVLYYNGNAQNIQTPLGKECGGISAWQGIRYLGADNYLLCGTTNPTPNTGNGLVYKGTIDGQDGTTTILNVPESLGTSVYGPNYDIETGIYTFVGSFLNYNQQVQGFVFQGKLENISSPAFFFYPSINDYYETTFFHSYSNGFFVGNSGTKDPLNPETVSYVYDFNDLSTIKSVIQYPGASTTTSYGIWHNGGSHYTIVGGYSDLPLFILSIYQGGQILPIGKAFIVDYDSETNEFSNWTSIDYKDGLLTHFQGIYGNEDGTYSINMDVVDSEVSILPQGYFLTISRNEDGSFSYNSNNVVPITYQENGITSSNSVANNKVVGLFVPLDEDESNVSYQASVIRNPISTTQVNTVVDTVQEGEAIPFDVSFLSNKYVSYENNIFTFASKGTYFVNFNLYIEKTTLPSINIQVNYTQNGDPKQFTIAQKGIDSIGTSTAHSLAIPCTFSNTFNINDTIQILNVSSGPITFVSNFVPNALNGIISISKIA